MSGDLEDFLRRAAQRRQAKAAQQQQSQRPAPAQRPQYTSRQTERVVDAIIVDEPVEAEAVPEDSLHARNVRLAEARKAAEVVKAEVVKAGRSGAPSPSKSAPTNVSIGNLTQLLNQRGGLAQAFLLREILDRPEHRW